MRNYMVHYIRHFCIIISYFTISWLELTFQVYYRKWHKQSQDIPGVAHLCPTEV